MHNQELLIGDIEKYGLLSSGRTALLKYLRGEKIHRPAAVKAKCCECMGYYADGRVDCENPDCPLYPYMPYRGKVSAEGAEEPEKESDIKS